MSSNKTTATNRLGLIVATMMENTNHSQGNDANRSSSSENDLREKKQEENVGSNPDPELEDPNFVPGQDKNTEENGLNESASDDEEEEDELINPIDPINALPAEVNLDPDDEDPLELPEEDENELDEIEPDDEVPVKENDDLNQSIPRELPEKDTDDELNTGEDQDDYQEERDISDENNSEKDFDHDDRNLEAEGLEAEDNRGNFL